MRVFGCRCFPYLRDYAKTKFDPRSLPCVFMGYSQHHKGYRCYIPQTGRVYISPHVIFDEAFFPYKDPGSLYFTSNTNLEVTLFQEWIVPVDSCSSSCSDNSVPTSNILIVPCGDSSVTVSQPTSSQAQPVNHPTSSQAQPVS